MRNFLIYTGFLFLLLFSVGFSVLATDYHVDGQAGNDNNLGTLSAPWKTISKANQVLLAGDRVFIHQSEYKNQQVAPKNSGKKGAPIVYQVFDNQKVVITDIGIGILLDKRSYIIVDGIQVNGKKEFKNATVNSWAQLHDAHHCIIKNCNFKFSKGWAGVSLDNGSQYNELLNNRMDYCGTWDDGNGEDKGDVIALKCAQFNLIEGNHLTHGGHNLLAIYDKFNVIRNNTFDNYWGKNSKGEPIGNRCVEISSVESKNCNGSVGGYNLFENNIIRNAYQASDNLYPKAIKIQGEFQIARKNLIYNTAQEGISGIANATVLFTRRNYIYNNTIHNTGGSGWRSQFTNGKSAYGNVFKNNIVTNVGSNPKNNKSNGYLYIAVAKEGNDVVNGHEVSGNCFYDFNKYEKGIFLEGPNYNSVEYFQKNYEDQFLNNFTDDPQFTNSTKVEAEDFQLKSNSKLIDAGVFLSKTTNSGSGDEILVEDVGYFSDGFGITEGDLIQVGNNLPVRIMDVDYKKNQLTIATRISWQKGDFVNLQFYGNGPDVGAFEYKKGSVSDNLTEISITGSLNFGEVEIGGSITKEITIKNTGNKTLKIENVALENGFNPGWTQAEIEVDNSKILNITFSPEKEGSFEESLVIKGNISGNQVSKTVLGKGKKKSSPLENKIDLILVDQEKGTNLDSLTHENVIFLKDWENIHLNIQAFPSTSDGSVIFYLNNSEYAQLNQKPYFLLQKGGISQLKPGKYKLTVRSFSEKNGLGQLISSRTISFTIIDASSKDFVFTSPGEGDEFEVKENIIFSLNLPDAQEEGKVEFFANDLKLGESLKKPYNFEWRFLTQGEYKIKAKKIIGNSIEISSELTINIINKSNLLPEIVIITPEDNATFSYGKNINIETIASDSDGTIDRVIFYNGKDTLGQVNSSPFIYTWEYPEPGKYQISTTAIDNNGGETESNIINIQVKDNNEKESDSTLNHTNIKYGPNPFSTYFSISLTHELEGNGNIYIVDLSGKELLNKTFFKDDGEFILIESTALWKPGLYFVKMIFLDQNVTFKLIKN